MEQKLTFWVLDSAFPRVRHWDTFRPIEKITLWEALLFNIEVQNRRQCCEKKLFLPELGIEPGISPEAQYAIHYAISSPQAQYAIHYAISSPQDHTDAMHNFLAGWEQYEIIA